MIEQIDIHDLGVISRATLPLGPGFIALTGETGAGKTMVVTALGLLLGQRADTARVRQGAQATWVEGHFRVDNTPGIPPRVDELGGSVDEGELVLARQISAEGRSKAVVGGRGAPVSVLQELAEHLVVVHGQSDQIRLRSEAAQREALDRFGGQELAGVLAHYGTLFDEHRQRSAQLQELDANRESHRQEAERLREALGRIEAVRPVAGEDETLKQQSARLESIEDLRAAAATAKEALSADQSGVDQTDARVLVDQAIRALERVSERDAELAPVLTSLREGLFQLDEAAQSLAGYLTGLTDGDGTDLESVMSRRAEISGLMRDYGPTLDDVLAFEQRANDTLLSIDVSGDARAELERLVAEGEEELTGLAARITGLRTQAAGELSTRVSDELHALAMPDARFVVDVQAREATSSGADQVQFLLAPHAGAEPRPLAKSASGGELSRVMLALEVVIAEADPVPTFIFDEVDSGVGGATALEIGRRLARLAQSAQVICVTHLPQVASCADTHLRVVKDQAGDVTQSSVQVLSGEDRLREIARMLGGDADSASAREHAQEMLERESVSRRAG